MADNRLSLAFAERDAGDGQRKASRYFLDFAVNGEQLAPKVRLAGYDLISCLWLHNATAAQQSVRAAHRLLGQVKGDAPHGRVSVYGCAECGDLGCGAITVRLQVTEDRVLWADWGYQNSYEDEVFDLDDVVGLRDFHFDIHEYEQVLAQAVKGIRDAC